MKNFRKLIVLLLIGAFTLSLTACERTRTVSGYYVGEDYEETDNIYSYNMLQ
jgi:predicted small secreted protein